MQCNLSDSGASIDSGSSITETQQQQKMPDLSETKLVQRKNNSMSAVVVPVSTGSSGDEFPHEDIEDKPLDSVEEEVRTLLFLTLCLAFRTKFTILYHLPDNPSILPIHEVVVLSKLHNFGATKVTFL